MEGEFNQATGCADTDITERGQERLAGWCLSWELDLRKNWPGDVWGKAVGLRKRHVHGAVSAKIRVCTKCSGGSGEDSSQNQGRWTDSELVGVRIQGPCCPADLWLLHNGVGSVVHVTATYLKTQQSTQWTVMVGYTIALSLVIWEKQTNGKCWEFTPREPIFHYDCTQRMWEQKTMGRASKQVWEIWMKGKFYFIFPEWMTLQLNVLLSSKTEEFCSLFIFLKKKKSLSASRLLSPRKCYCAVRRREVQEVNRAWAAPEV